ncbi:MAG: Asp-tRNA(Asn)/Glu-tRNA(Gln) amidotransferase subunit GatC [Candidatus Nomurabacteria bacterium]|jgi:aspartyl-tRNA(Asn)/glutamyl-tRNA(Gln) amidotransferase subunit C|nr:Asp-tRNA(Asn)/Glu-tRNA(Gln) amidotransferase subunit GatC [Candidatus Nomurabacteria bacterium]
MKIDETTARYLASLSNITLSDADLKNLTADLEKIIDYIGELGELDTAGVEPTYQVTGLANVWRADEIKPQLAREKLLKLAPARVSHAVRVPKVL